MKPDQKELSMWQWFWTFVILWIPIVNIVMLFIWSFSSAYNPRTNFARAALVMVAVLFALSLFAMLLPINWFYWNGACDM